MEKGVKNQERGPFSMKKALLNHNSSFLAA
jgi:hypothetical protein